MYILIPEPVRENLWPDCEKLLTICPEAPNQEPDFESQVKHIESKTNTTNNTWFQSHRICIYEYVCTYVYIYIYIMYAYTHTYIHVHLPASHEGPRGARASFPAAHPKMMKHSNDDTTNNNNKKKKKNHNNHNNNTSINHNTITFDKAGGAGPRGEEGPWHGRSAGRARVVYVMYVMYVMYVCNVCM